jgi:hypothetical protein
MEGWAYVLDKRTGYLRVILWKTGRNSASPNWEYVWTTYLQRTCRVQLKSKLQYTRK